MTRITIWETPDNREQYRDVSCEVGTLTGIQPCGITLGRHGVLAMPQLTHLWAIYRDAEQPAHVEARLVCEGDLSDPARECIDPGCLLHDHTAAPATAAEPATGETTLPDKTVTEGSGTVDFSPTDAGVERVQAARPRTSCYLVLADDGKLYGYERSDVLRLHIAEHRVNGESPRQIFRLITASLVVTYEPIAEEAIV